jgi:hypothetical protein
VKVHLHISFLHAFCTFLEFILAWIPVKLVAASFEDRSALASAVLRVL